jgi:hypothetical protein
MHEQGPCDFDQTTAFAGVGLVRLRNGFGDLERRHPVVEFATL